MLRYLLYRSNFLRDYISKTDVVFPFLKGGVAVGAVFSAPQCVAVAVAALVDAGFLALLIFFYRNHRTTAAGADIANFRHYVHLCNKKRAIYL